MTTTASSRLAIRKLNYKQIGKLYLTILIMLRDRIPVAKARMFAEPINKTTDFDIRFFLGRFVNRRFEGESTEETLFGFQIHALHDMIGARKPMLLTLFEALIAMAARDKQAIIFLIIEMTNVDL